MLLKVHIGMSLFYPYYRFVTTSIKGFKFWDLDLNFVNIPIFMQIIFFYLNQGQVLQVFLLKIKISNGPVYP